MAHPYESKREMHPGRKAAESRVKGYATGGAVPAPALARGGHTKGKHNKGGTHIKIAVVAPQGKPDAGLPPGPPAGMPPGGPPMAPPPGLAPPGAGGPPGMPPMKRGGAVYAKGGKVPMKSGADSGPGRIEKAKAYGLKPLKKG